MASKKTTKPVAKKSPPKNAAPKKAAPKKAAPKKAAPKKAAPKKAAPKKAAPKKAAPKKAAVKTPTAHQAAKPATRKVASKSAPTKKLPQKAAAAPKSPKATPSKTAPPKTAPPKTAPPKTAPSKAGTADLAPLVGKTAPAFHLQDQHGHTVTSAGLKGKPYVLYFYPKDNTPGCTNEACAFRDDQRNFLDQGVTILGVSPDSVKSHAGFADKYDLPFSLLSDPDKVLANAYGVWALKKNYGREYMGIVRSTFLVGANGKVLREWRGVKVSGHSAEVLSEVSR